ncbi:MAG: hypothetical protein AB1899_12115 [Pseudomonadota bacterium]
MKRSIKGALLSGLVLPGLGQVVLKEYVRGYLIMAVALGCMVWFVNGAVEAAMQSLATLTSLEQAPPAAPSGAAFWALLLVWAAAVVDAYRIGARQDRMPADGH